ncbi:MAG: hypothetical protein NZO58_09295 [Gemmataceae bacterium]|nr:hypothetical protein [Gemmataceae bacterium]
MRRWTQAVWWSLALVWLAIDQAAGSAACGAGAWRREVTGRGTDLRAAQRAALDQAVAVVTERLHALGLWHWQPDGEFVRRHCLIGAGRAGPDEPLTDGLVAKTWTFNLCVPSDQTLRRLDAEAWRRDTSTARMGVALRVVVALAWLLAVFVGQVRLEQWTRGRHSAVVRTMALGAGAAGLAWAWGA